MFSAQDGREHAHAFTETADGVRFCRVEQRQYGTIYVGDSIVRKTDTRLSKGKDVVVRLPGARIEHVTEKVEKIMGRGKGGTILVHIGTNDADKEGTTAIVEKYRKPTEEDEASKGWTDNLIRNFTSVW